MELSINTFELGHKIADSATPERCKPCELPEKMGIRLARAVLGGVLKESEAIDQLRSLIDDDCPAGPLQLLVNNSSIENICRQEPTLEIPRIAPLEPVLPQPLNSSDLISNTRATLMSFGQVH